MISIKIMQIRITEIKEEAVGRLVPRVGGRDIGKGVLLSLSHELSV
jgi:hypothetical protein